ncbi:hypothetical protein [Rhodococcus jostii]|uniref:Uncharacterized protein n=1 Tax=Rhodococcus jostii TaxID=132919 RepID=A0ABU4CTZ7_RHOJO|nr:hypothetical protein [Rhodococcus jostii]MDV6286567.1 hypothetical protein [Rhodococcus jostii]
MTHAVNRGCDLDHAFTADVLAEFTRTGWLGGRTGSWHGQIATALAAPRRRWPGGRLAGDRRLPA